MSIQNKISHSQSLITDQKKISSGYFRLSFFASEIAGTAQPGQFIHIFCGEGTYLRRPFSIAGIKKNRIEIIYRVVGKGSELLSQKKKGDLIDVIGPLGTGYQITNYKLQITNKVLFIAGGTGVASLLFLAQHLSTYKHINLPTVVLIGAKTKNDLLAVSDFKKIGCPVELATEDGSLGFHGLVTDLFRRYLSTYQLINLSTVYACGPYPMLKKISEICQNKRIKCQVSLEAMMACGIGACRGCVIKVKSEKCKVKSGNSKPLTLNFKPFIYKTVCKDGPVFDAKEIIWD